MLDSGGERKSGASSIADSRRTPTPFKRSGTGRWLSGPSGGFREARRRPGSWRPRGLVKRQRTWLARETDIRWVDPEEAVARALALLGEEDRETR
jgi:hypothetical protein